MVDVSTELAVRELVARYGDAVSRRNIDDWAATWAEDCVWEFRGAVIEGLDQARAVFQKALDQYEWLYAVGVSGFVEDGPNGPRGTWYVLEFNRERDGTMRQAVGRYHDEYVQVGGVWKFAKRSWTRGYMAPVAAPESLAAFD